MINCNTKECGWIGFYEYVWTVVRILRPMENLRATSQPTLSIRQLLDPFHKKYLSQAKSISNFSLRFLSLHSIPKFFTPYLQLIHNHSSVKIGGFVKDDFQSGCFVRNRQGKRLQLVIIICLHLLHFGPPWLVPTTGSPRLDVRRDFLCCETRLKLHTELFYFDPSVGVFSPAGKINNEKTFFLSIRAAFWIPAGKRIFAI